jgi:hypothetical protein
MATKRKKRSRKVSAKSTASRPLAKPRVVSSNCIYCGALHQGDSEESLATLDPEAAVYFDRDLADQQHVIGLCGPRFRISSLIGLHAHYGSAASGRDRYVVFHWDAEALRWDQVIPPLRTDVARREFIDLLGARAVALGHR